MLLEILVGVLIVCIALYLIWRLVFAVPYSFEKFIKNGKSVVVVKANKPLARIALSDSADGEELTFIRRNIKKGDLIEFVYPPSQESAVLVIKDEKGTHTFRIEPRVK